MSNDNDNMLLKVIIHQPNKNFPKKEGNKIKAAKNGNQLIKYFGGNTM